MKKWNRLLSGLGHLVAWVIFILKRVIMKRIKINIKKRLRSLNVVEYCPHGLTFGRLSIAKAKLLSNDQDINLSEGLRYYKNVRIKNIRGWVARNVG